jgi:hypothetical protein
VKQDVEEGSSVGARVPRSPEPGTWKNPVKAARARGRAEQGSVRDFTGRELLEELKKKQAEEAKGPKPDSYGYVTNGAGKRVRRHPKCRCEVPCQMRFQCRSRHHKGNRSTPWCNGADPGESCDTCWSFENKRREKLQAAAQARWNY